MNSRGLLLLTGCEATQADLASPAISRANNKLQRLTIVQILSVGHLDVCIEEGNIVGRRTSQCLQLPYSLRQARGIGLRVQGNVTSSRTLSFLPYSSF